MSRNLRPAKINHLALTVLWWVFSLSLFVHIGSTRVLQVRLEWTDAAGLLCLLCMLWLTRRQLRELPTGIAIAAGVFLLTACLALIATPGWGHALKFLGYCGLIISAVLCWVWTYNHTRVVAGSLRWLLLLVVITTLGGWLLALFNIEGWDTRRFQGAVYFPMDRAIGLTSHPNRAAWVLLTIYGLFLLCWRPQQRLLDDALAWLTPWIGLLTFATFSPLLFAQLGIVLLVRVNKGSGRSLALFLIVSAMLATVLLSYVAPVRDTTGAWQLRPAPRALIHTATISTFEHVPWLGQGLATKASPIFSTGYPPVTIPRAADAHNAYLDLLATGGVVLLLGFIVFIWGLARPPVFLWHGIVLIWLYCGLVHSINDERMLFFGLGVGAALSMVRLRTDDAAPV